MRKTLLTLTLAAAPFAAFADTLDDLKAQGFARIAIANEPPFTSVAADGPVSEILTHQELLEENNLELPLSMQKR